jgi:hypothetical protein
MVMSDPWSSVMPGGVSFSRQNDDEEQEWAYDTPSHDTSDEAGDEVGEDTPHGQTPETPEASEGEGASTDVDTETVHPSTGDGSGGGLVEGLAQWDAPAAPVLPTAPLPVVRPVVRVLPKAPPGTTAGEGVLPSLPVTPPTHSTTPDEVPNEVPGEGDASDEGEDPAGYDTPASFEGEGDEVPAQEGEPARGGLHRVPSSPRGPRPAWMTNPALVAFGDTDGEGDDADDESTEGEGVVFEQVPPPAIPVIPPTVPMVPPVVPVPVAEETPSPALPPIPMIVLPGLSAEYDDTDDEGDEYESDDADDVEGEEQYEVYDETDTTGWVDDDSVTFIGGHRDEDAHPHDDDTDGEGDAGVDGGEGLVPELDGYAVDPTTGEVLDTPYVPVTPIPVTPAPVAPAPVVQVPSVPSVTAAPPVPLVPSVPVVNLKTTPAGKSGKKAVLDVGSDWDPADLLNPDSDEAVEEKKQTKKAAAKKKNKDYSIALTDRDMAMLQFLARYRFATYPQLARYFETTPVALRQRMPRLAKEGIVVRKTIGKSQHGVWLPTDTGIKVSGLDLPTPTLSWATAAHTLGLVDVGVMYELEGETVVTEREIRAADTRDRPSARMVSAMKYAGVDPDEPIEDGSLRMYVVNLGGGESHYGHIPDMVLVRPPAPDGSPASVAIELELVHKPATQWRKMLRAYLNAPHFGEVIYYTSQRKIAAGVAKAAQEVGAEHMVSVRRFSPSESSAIAQSSK